MDSRKLDDHQLITNALEKLQKVWINSGNADAMDAARKLKDVLYDNNAVVDRSTVSEAGQDGALDGNVSLLQERKKIELVDFNSDNLDTLDLHCCPPPDEIKMHLKSQKNLDQEKQDLSNAIENIIDVVKWIHPRQLADTIGDRIGGEDDFKYAMILGSKQTNAVVESGDMHLGLLYLSVGKTYPQHAREANEMFYIMAGSTQSGATLQHLKTINSGEFISYDIAAPRVFMVPTGSEPLLMIFCRTGDLNGQFWLSENRSKPSRNHFLKNIIQDYDDIAEDYEDLVRSWGYNMPEVVIKSLIDHANIHAHQNPKILDLACGDGLCGLMLKVKSA